MVFVVNKLFPRVRVAEKKVDQLKSAIAGVDRKRPQSRTGRQQFFRVLVTEAKAKAGTLCSTNSVRRKIMKRSFSFFQEDEPGCKAKV